MKRASKGMATFTCARGVRFAFSGGRRSTCTQRCPPQPLLPGAQHGAGRGEGGRGGGRRAAAHGGPAGVRTAPRPPGRALGPAGPRYTALRDSTRGGAYVGLLACTVTAVSAGSTCHSPSQPLLHGAVDLTGSGAHLLFGISERREALRCCCSLVFFSSVCMFAPNMSHLGGPPHTLGSLCSFAQLHTLGVKVEVFELLVTVQNKTGGKGHFSRTKP